MSRLEEEIPKCNYCHHRQNVTRRLVYHFRKCEWCGKPLYTKREWFIKMILNLMNKEN